MVSKWQFQWCKCLITLLVVSIFYLHTALPISAQACSVSTTNGVTLRGDVSHLANLGSESLSFSVRPEGGPPVFSISVNPAVHCPGNVCQIQVPQNSLSTLANNLSSNSGNWFVTLSGNDGGSALLCGGPINAANIIQAVANQANPDPVDGGNIEFGTTGENVTNGTFDMLNPLKQFQDQPVPDDLSTPAGIINRALFFAFPIAGLILFVMLVWGGFEMLAGAATKKSLDAGRQRITAAIIGFILLFCSYWLMKIVQAIFGAQVL